MLVRQEYNSLKTISDLPLADRVNWLSSAEQGVEYLKANATRQHILIYASMGATYVCSVLVPDEAVTPPDVDDLLRAYFSSDDTWRIQRSYGGGEEHKVYLEPPMSSPGCKSLVGAEPFIFRRSFHGMKNHETEIEFNQKLIHALDLFHMPERHAYSKLDERGDLADVISIEVERHPEPFKSCTAIFMDAAYLAEYTALSGQSLYRKFDFTRVAPETFGGWSNQKRAITRSPDLFYNTGLVPGHASYANGGQIVRTRLTVEELIARWKDEMSGANRQYETFKIWDRKNEMQVECSASPEHRDSYFVRSDKPWDVSPAFFRPEVLAKYKADPSKYEIDERSITCRNAWHLKTYDINDAGQVHTYLVYLADLPYEEQQYWKLFNEWPKANISKRAFENDILGEFASERQPLAGIKDTVAKFDRRAPPWWKPRGEDLAARVLIPATDSEKEWSDEVLALDQLVVEGFVATKLRVVGTTAGATIDLNWGSLRTLEAVLGSLGVSPEQVMKTMEPLKYLHHLRSKVKGHAASAEAKALVREAKTEHGTFRAHFTDLCDRCDGSLLVIERALAAIT